MLDLQDIATFLRPVGSKRPQGAYGRPAQATIVAMMPSRVLRVTGEQMKQYFDQSIISTKKVT